MENTALVVKVVLFMIPLLLSLSVQESAHAWTANKLGDPTAKLLGRVSLNPLAHLDPIGTVILPIIMYVVGGSIFGWAKPVPVNPMNLKNYRKDVFWISLAGPLSNFIMAFFAALGLIILGKLFNVLPFGLRAPLTEMLRFGLHLNILLCFFNLIPLGPLDGAKILNRFVPESMAQVLENFSNNPMSMMILFFFVFGGLLGGIIGPVGNFFITLFLRIGNFIIP